MPAEERGPSSSNSMAMEESPGRRGSTGAGHPADAYGREASCSQAAPACPADSMAWLSSSSSSWSSSYIKRRPLLRRTRPAVEQLTRYQILEGLLIGMSISLMLSLMIMMLPRRARTKPFVIIDDAEVDGKGTENDYLREFLMALGMTLLLVSLGVCFYSMYRLGFCCNRSEDNSSQRTESGNASVNSRLLLSGSDRPPTYDAIMLTRDDLSGSGRQPPSYLTVIAFEDEKVVPPPPPPPAPKSPINESAGAAPAAVGAGSHPQEAG